MNASARVAAQAKINLFLDVLERDARGYHALETAFLRIDLADDVAIRESPGRSLAVSGPSLPLGGLGPNEKNLAYRAAVAYADAAGWPSGFSIDLVKRIPAGAGLGGGSADAGAVLRALEALSPTPLGPRLAEIASGLGADVPFMTIDEPMALGSGRGDRVKPIRPLEPRAIVLAVPSFGISTTDAYAWLDADRSAQSDRPRPGLAEPVATWDDAASSAHNDFAAVVARRHPEIATLTERLLGAGASIAMLAGSGSTVFGIFESAPDVASLGFGADVRVITTRTSDRVERVTVDR
ncbi:MAG TPA: 4-(cytidine 5'-diphospho)-2-C-methyl-D-erythritol kinase [Gemmatimonadaceae bacterium]|nr:4-(cytidine 5'-diphospho)-2-C-methyl-D-erythritol kinase [Gemmatimonadaceae bacterium]